MKKDSLSNQWVKNLFVLRDTGREMRINNAKHIFKTIPLKVEYRKYEIESVKIETIFYFHRKYEIESMKMESRK